MSVTHTFRINAKTNDILVEEAKRAGINLNAFVNRWLNRYASTYRFFLKNRTVTMSRRAFSYLLTELAEERLTAIGRKLGSEDPPEFSRIFGKEYDRESFEFFLKEVLPVAGWFECEEGLGSTSNSFFLHHTYGPKWTLFLRAFLEGMTATFYTKVKIELTKEGLYCELPNSHSKTDRSE